MLGIITALISGGIPLVKQWLTSKGEQELAKQESARVSIEAEATVKKAAAEAKAKAMVTRMEGDIAWENIMATGSTSSWKDEWFTMLLSTPYLVCLWPSVVTAITDPGNAHLAVQQSITAMSTIPDSWNYLTGVACTASFGIKKATDFFALKKGV